LTPSAQRPYPKQKSSTSTLCVPRAPRYRQRTIPTPSADPPEQRPVGVLTGEGKAAVGEAEEVLLLVVDEGGIAPALLSALHLEVVEEPGVPLPLLGLGEFPEPSHVRIVCDVRPRTMALRGPDEGITAPTRNLSRYRRRLGCWGHRAERVSGR
jgi:hypothetical protein